MLVAPTQSRSDTAFEVLQPPRARNCPLLERKGPSVHRPLLRHLEATYRRTQAAYTTWVARAHPGLDPHQLINMTLGDTLAEWPHHQAEQALHAGIVTYFTKPGNFRSIQNPSVAGAIHELAARHPKIDKAPLFRKVKALRDLNITAYSTRVSKKALVDFFETQTAQIKNSGLPTRVKEIALKSLQAARDNPDENMSRYADTAYLIMAVDFALKTRAAAIKIKNVPRSGLLTAVDFNSQEDVLNASFRLYEAWDRLAEKLADGLDPSLLCYELHLDSCEMDEKDLHMYKNFVSLARRQNKIFSPYSLYAADEDALLDAEAEQVKLRLLPPSRFEWLVKFVKPEFDGLVYQSRPATPSESVQLQLKYRHEAALFWQPAIFADYLENKAYPLVRGFYFLEHDLYHCADKILASAHTKEIVAPLWRAMGQLPQRYIRTAGIQAVIRALLDLEVASAIEVDELIQRTIILPLKLYYVHHTIINKPVEATKFTNLWHLYKQEEKALKRHLAKLDIIQATPQRKKEYRDILSVLLKSLSYEEPQPLLSVVIKVLQGELRASLE